MRELSSEGHQALNDLAGRYGVSTDAVEHLLMAILAGQTTQAQFNHPELGGMGQWSQGGMTMVGDMFNHGLKAKVDGLCSELAALARSTQLHRPMAPQQSQSHYQGGGVSLFVPADGSFGNWWPDGLGHPASTGAQNDLRYAFFPATRRLALDIGGRISVYDTRDHQIGGFSQQQGGDQLLSFTSQYGLVRVSDLAVIAPGDATGAIEPAPIPASHAAPQRVPDHPLPAPATAPAREDDIFDKIERLAALHAKGVLTDAEFSAKKTDLLDRL